MKKYTALLSASLVLIFVLSGCYMQDSTVKINLNGSVDAVIESLASPEVIERDLGGSFDENVTSMIDSYNEHLAKNPGDVKEFNMEPLSKDTENGLYQGVKATMKFESLSQMFASQIFGNLTQAAPITNTSGMQGGILFTEKHTMFGVTYRGGGTISLSAQGDQAGSGSYIRQAFKFPSLFIKHNAPETAELGTKLIWVATAETPAEVEFSVFVPNLALAIATLLIVLMAIWIAVLTAKNKAAVAKEENESDAVESFVYTYSGDKEYEEFPEEELTEEDPVEEEDIREDMQEQSEEQEESEEE